MTHPVENGLPEHRPAFDESGHRTGFCVCGDGQGHHLPPPVDADDFEPPTVGSEGI